jgi:hypothetical protein
MGATTTIQNTIDFSRPFVNWAFLSIGDNNEPAFTAAKLALQTIVGPPFKWSWNRSTLSFLMTTGVQDYTAFISNYGFLETASVQPAAVITSVTVAAGIATFTALNDYSAILATGMKPNVTNSGCTTSGLNVTGPLLSATPTSYTMAIAIGNMTESEAGASSVCGPIMPLELKDEALTNDTAQDRPSFISTQSSDESGVNFTFRFLPVPGQAYRCILTYQESPSTIVNMNSTWGIPDPLQYLYTYFFLWFMLDYFQDAQAAKYRQLAIASLLARQSGLSLTDRNLFLGNYLDLMEEEQESAQKTQQGNQARGL